MGSILLESFEFLVDFSIFDQTKQKNKNKTASINTTFWWLANRISNYPAGIYLLHNGDKHHNNNNTIIIVKYFVVDFMRLLMEVHPTGQNKLYTYFLIVMYNKFSPWPIYLKVIHLYTFVSFCRSW